MSTTTPQNISNYGSYFDKGINLTFLEFNPANPNTPNTNKNPTIVCSATGYKPKISLSGSLIVKTLFCHIELRIQNAFITFDAGHYKYVQIQAGYQANLKAPDGSVSKDIPAMITGQITQAYVETPGPDGITLFIILLSSDEIFNTEFDFNYQWKTQNLTRSGVLRSLCDLMKQKSGLTYNVDLPTPLDLNATTDINHSGSFANLVDQIVSKDFLLTYTLENQLLKVFTQGQTSATNFYTIDKVTNTPSSLVGGQISFQAPWLPMLRPDNIIYINPSFMKLTFGAYQTNNNNVNSSIVNQKTGKLWNYYQIIKIDFDFDTIDPVNKMIVNALGYDGPLPANGFGG